MAEAILLRGGGGVTSDDVTATKKQVLKGYTALTADGDDEPIEGTMENRGYHGPDSTECWLYPAEGGYVVRLEEGFYHKDESGYKPYVITPTALVKNAVGYKPEKTLSDTTTCGEQGQVKMIDTGADNYSANKQSTAYGIDYGRGTFYIDLPHGDAYYHRGDGHPHTCIDADKLGDAGADSVLQGQTATSRHGVKLEGTIPRWICTTGDVINANNGAGWVWDDVYAGRGRGIVVGIPNGAFIQGANFVFLPSPNLRSPNIRAGVDINGEIGTMIDYGAGRRGFDGATFDGVLISGVANKGFVLRHIARFLNLKNSSIGFVGIQDGGLKMRNFYSGRTNFQSATDVGFVLAHSINLEPFRQIKIGFRFLNFSGAGTQSQPARAELEVGVTNADHAGAERLFAESYTVVKELGFQVRHVTYVMTSTRPSAGNISDGSQQYMILDVSGISGHHFIYFMLGNIVHEYSLGSVSVEVIINSIEFIN
nr:MAG TPA: hypothetical protein [Caudoviricetes sp.]